MKYSLLDIRQIRNKDIRKYFSETIDCYEIGAYRATLQSLYSVVLYDLVYKLLDLRDEYEDRKASAILSEIEPGLRYNSSDSQWEKDLLKKLHSEADFELIDNDVNSTLKTLKEKRNLSAHPSFNGSEEIFYPSREFTFGLMKEVYDKVLVQNSYFLSNQNDRIRDFLSDNSYEFTKITDIFDNKQNIFLENLFYNRYYQKLTDRQIIQLFQMLWKFVFYLDNEDCRKNQLINLFIIDYIYKKDNKNDIIKAHINDEYSNGKLSLILNHQRTTEVFLIYLSFRPDIWKQLPGDFQEKIKSGFSSDSLFPMLWYLSDDLETHFEKLSEIDILQPNFFFNNDKQVGLFISLCKNIGALKEFCDLSLDYLEKVRCYDIANNIINHLVIPLSKNYSREQQERYKKLYQKNHQIRCREAAERTNLQILDNFKEKG